MSPDLARRRRGASLAWGALFAVSLGCSSPSLGGAAACAEESYLPVTGATPLGTRTLAPRVAAEPFRLIEPGFLQVHLDPVDACVQIVRATDETDAELITLDGARTFCRDCPERTALLPGGGLFGIPTDATQLGAFVDVQLGLRSCKTLGPVADQPSSVLARIAHWPRGDLGVPTTARGVLRVDLLLLGESFLGESGRTPLALSWVQQVETLLSDAGLRVDLHAVCTLDAATDNALVVEAGDAGEVEAVLSRARAACPGFTPSAEDPRITVLYAPCLRFHDPLFATTTTLDGYTTHIPGGFAPEGVADAVVLGGGCELPRGLDGSGLPLGLARDLAHELGHYLGLFHSVEADGETVDTLDDTDGADLMNARPSLATARGLSPAQVRVLRAHPAVRWPIDALEACADPH